MFVRKVAGGGRQLWETQKLQTSTMRLLYAHIFVVYIYSYDRDCRHIFTVHIYTVLQKFFQFIY